MLHLADRLGGERDGQRRLQRIVRFLFLLSILSLWFSPPPLRAADGPDAGTQETDADHLRKQDPGPRWIQSADLDGTFNPKGIDLFYGIAYQDPYRYDSRRSEVSSSWEAGTVLGLTPSDVQPALYFEWMPAPFVTGRLEYDGYYYFGANGGSLSFSSAEDHFGDPELRARQGTEVSGVGSRLLFQPTFQARIGDIVIRNQTDIARYRFPGPGPYYLSQEYDTLLLNNGTLFANRTQLLKEMPLSDGKLLAGPYYEYVRGAEGTRVRRQIGILLYLEQSKPNRADSEKHYVAQVGYDLTDQNREGQVFFLIGLGFSSGF